MRVLTQLAFYVNLHRAVIGPSATLTGRWRPDIDLRRMLTEEVRVQPCKIHWCYIKRLNETETLIFWSLICFVFFFFFFLSRSANFLELIIPHQFYCWYFQGGISVAVSVCVFAVSVSSLFSVKCCFIFDYTGEAPGRFLRGVQFNHITVLTLRIPLGQTGKSKQCRPRSDAAERGVWSGSTLFVTSQQFYTHSQAVKMDLLKRSRRKNVPNLSNFIQNFPWKWKWIHAGFDCPWLHVIKTLSCLLEQIRKYFKVSFIDFL